MLFVFRAHAHETRGAHDAPIAVNGKLYSLANNTKPEGFILEIDPATASIREVIRSRSDAFESHGAINVSGLATDGKSLFTTPSGQLLYIILHGKVKSLTGDRRLVRLPRRLRSDQGKA